MITRLPRSEICGLTVWGEFDSSTLGIHGRQKCRNGMMRYSKWCRRHSQDVLSWKGSGTRKTKKLLWDPGTELMFIPRGCCHFWLAFPVCSSSKSCATDSRTDIYNLWFLLELHTLKLSFVPGPLSSTSHQLATLRHLSLVWPERYHEQDGAEIYTFLQVRHLPNLDSLAISGTAFNSPNFLSSFRQCAPRLRFLCIENENEHRNPPMFISECRNLAHLCVSVWFSDLYPLLTTIPSMRLLSFTTAWYSRFPGNCLTWEEDLQEICKGKSISLEKAHLYLIPARQPSYDREILRHSLALGLKWEVLPKPEDNLVESVSEFWERHRLKLV